MKLVLTGGFLGSGKTTAIANACAQLLEDQVRVAVITNDQGEQLVDSAYIAKFGIPVREVGNGCFCCNYSRLDEHIQSLFEINKPEIIFAESVGSCTDLIGTIARPMARFRPKMEVVISIFADAALLLSLLEGRASFIDDRVRYIYKKQLEEADILSVNKVDLITRGQLKIIDEFLRNEYPDKILLHQNSKTKPGINHWLEEIENFKTTKDRLSLAIDYDIYAEGEAQLAWHDNRIAIHSKQDDALEIAGKIMRDLHEEIHHQGMAIAHLKFIVESGDWLQKYSATITGVDLEIEASAPVTDHCMLLINARIQTDPLLLKKLTDTILKRASINYDCTIVSERSSSFKPGYPKPEHRSTN
jgi:G3E family GTPase